MEVWSHEYVGADGTIYQVTDITGLTPEYEAELRKTVAYRAHINNAQSNGTGVTLPHTIIPGTGDPTKGGIPTKYTPVNRTAWVDIVKAVEDKQKADAKAKRIADRKAARQAAATALKAALTANKIGLDPKSDRIVITDTVATTVAQLASGGLTSEGEPA